MLAAPDDLPISALQRVVGAGLLGVGLRVRGRPCRVLVAVIWGVFVVVWFGVGLVQIADGLL